MYDDMRWAFITRHQVVISGTDERSVFLNWWSTGQLSINQQLLSEQCVCVCVCACACTDCLVFYHRGQSWCGKVLFYQLLPPTDQVTVNSRKATKTILRRSAQYTTIVGLWMMNRNK